MYSMEVCVSTVSIIVGDDALGVPIFLTHWINRDYHNDVTPKIIWHQWYNNYALFLRMGRPFLWNRNCVAPLQICCRWVRVSAVYIRFSSCVRGATLGIMPLVAYTQNTAMHTHALTQVLYSLFQNLSSYSLSRRACTCPQVSKRFLLIPKSTTFVA